MSSIVHACTKRGVLCGSRKYAAATIAFGMVTCQRCKRVLAQLKQSGLRVTPWRL